MSQASELTITFQQMFLLINRVNGATVELPSVGHTATLTGSMLDEPIVLSDADVRIARDGLDYVDAQTLRPGARYLPYLDYVFHGRVRPQPRSSLAVVPPELNARVILAGGWLTELQASDPKARGVQWAFTTASGEVTLVQELTDQVRFTLPLDAGAKYELVIRTSGKSPSTTRLPIPAGGAHLTLINTDAAPKRWTEDKGFYRLKEYAILYNLTTAAAALQSYPYPSARVEGLGSNNDPLCGGGQSDGGDDPPPPPPG
ncbi:MAG: hypothetical protein IT185_04145 [Acidobacteria bacterium]|jgi:hypothetical protein|nr:hypothetical protein [Acidobacteriota bacterium]